MAIEVAKTHDADVAGVVVFDMGALIDDGSSFPDAASPIDNVVVADVAEVSAEVGFAYAVETRLGVRNIGGPERIHAVVVNGDAVDAGHRIEA